MLQLNVFFHALALLCGLGSVAFATVEGPTRRGSVAMALGLAATAVFLRPDRLADPGAVGVLVACLALASLVRPGAMLFAAAGSGALAGLWARMLQSAGVAAPVAFVAAAAAPVVTLVLMRRRSDFAPPLLRQDALLVVLALAVVVAMAPGIVAGWQSAALLNIRQMEAASPPLPSWTLLVSLGAATLGGLYTVWTRR